MIDILAKVGGWSRGGEVSPYQLHHFPSPSLPSDQLYITPSRASVASTPFAVARNPALMSRTRQPGANSHLQTTTESRDSSTARLTGTLRLRGEETPDTSEPSPARRIRWSEDVVDNEGMGKKSSKGQ